MSDPVVAAPGSVPQPQAPVAPAAPAAPVVTPPAPSDADQNPSWLTARLERERRTYLAGLGFQTEAEATAARDAAKAIADSKKSAEEREAARIAEVTGLNARVAEYESTFAQSVAHELFSLTAEQRSDVERITGASATAVAQLKAINSLKPVWARGSGAPVATPPAPIAAPGSSAPAAPAPPPPNPNPQPNHLATYQDLEKRDPMSAAAYLLQHHDAISRAQTPRA